MKPFVSALLFCTFGTQALSADLFVERSKLCAASNVERWNSDRTHLYGNTFGNRSFLCKTSALMTEQKVPAGQAALDLAECEHLSGKMKVKLGKLLWLSKQ